MNGWVQGDLLDLLESHKVAAPSIHVVGRAEPFRVASQSYCWRCDKRIEEEFAGVYQYLGRDALTTYQEGESEELHASECPFTNGGHAPIRVSATPTLATYDEDYFVECLCGWKIGDTLYEEHLVAALSPGVSEPKRGDEYCPQCDETMNATLFAFNHVRMSNGLCLALSARLTKARAHIPIKVEITELGHPFIHCECGWKFGRIAFQEHVNSAP